MGRNDNLGIGFKHSVFAPHDPSVIKYYCWDGMPLTATPWEYRGWQVETLSWKESCYIHAFLSDCCGAIPVKGPDAEKLMSHMCVNSFTLDKFPVGRAKHVIACAPNGNISAHGMCLRLAEDEFLTYFLEPNVDAHCLSGKFDVEAVQPDYESDFIFQLAGPCALEVVENALRQDIHDLKFMQFINATILGYEVRVLRMGMGGSLAYEIHGPMDHIFEIYDEIVRVGEAYGLVKLGALSYMCNHTENGFPQIMEHFMGDWYQDPELAALFESSDADAGAEAVESNTQGVGFDEVQLRGSLADMGLEAYYLNPIEAGWGRFIDWNHDFVGKEALRCIADDPRTRRVVTLEWDKEGVLSTFATYLDDEEGVSNLMRFPQDYEDNPCANLADKVVDSEGNYIGKSTGRIYTLYYKKVISMAFLDPEFAEEGTEVTIIWGDADHRQVPVKARVARYPYLDMPRNKDYDIESIPRYKKG